MSSRNCWEYWARFPQITGGKAANTVGTREKEVFVVLLPEDAWKMFEHSGKIEDYMRYKRLEQSVAAPAQGAPTEYADNDRRHGDSGTPPWRGR